MNRLNSTLVRPKLMSSPILMPVALSSLRSCASSAVWYSLATLSSPMTLSSTSRWASYSPTHSLVRHLDLTLPLSLQPPGNQLDLHRLLIDLLQEPVPQNRMHLERGPHDLLGNLAMLQRHDS